MMYRKTGDVILFYYTTHAANSSNLMISFSYRPTHRKSVDCNEVDFYGYNRPRREVHM